MVFHLSRPLPVEPVAEPPYVPHSVNCIIGHRDNDLPQYCYTSDGRLNIRRIFYKTTTKPMKFFSDHRGDIIGNNQIPQSIKNLLSLNDRIIIETGGEPAFVKGDYLEMGVAVISSDFREMMSAPEIRRRNDELVFPSGRREPRSECWSLAAVVCPNNEEIKYRVNEPETSEISRDLVCSVCLEDLSGALVSCCNQHQIHFGCYQRIVSSGRTVCCPTCRGRMLKPNTNRTEVSKNF